MTVTVAREPAATRAPASQAGPGELLLLIWWLCCPLCVIMLAVEPLPYVARHHWQRAFNSALAAVIMFVTAAVARGLLGHGALMVLVTYASTLAGLKLVRIRLPRPQKGQNPGVAEAHPRAQEAKGN